MVIATSTMFDVNTPGGGENTTGLSRPAAPTLFHAPGVAGVMKFTCVLTRKSAPMSCGSIRKSSFATDRFSPCTASRFVPATSRLRNGVRSKSSKATSAGGGVNCTFTLSRSSERSAPPVRAANCTRQS